jgi:hypothetical protein
LETVKQHPSVVEFQIILDEFDFSDYHTPAGELKKLWEKAEDELKKQLQTEIDCLNFSFSKGKLQPMFSTTDKSGMNVNEYPTLKAFDEEAFNYIINRLQTTPNKRLKARYGQILWNSELKGKGKYAQQAVDAYFDTIADEGTKADNFCSDIGNLLFISIACKHRSDEAKKLVLGYVMDSEPPFDSYLIFVPKVLSLKKHFDESVLNDIHLKAEKIWTDSVEMSLHTYERILEIAIIVAEKSGANKKIWHHRLAEIYERIIDQRKDDETGMMPLEFCERAIHHCKLAGNKAKEKQLLKRLTELKANLKLSTIEIKFTSKELSKLYKYHEEVIGRLVKHEPDKIIGFLSTDINIFPSAKQLKRAVAGRKKSFMDFANVIKYDINKNSSRRVKGDGNLEAIFEEYSWYVQIVTIPFLRELFRQGLYEQKINFKTVVEFLYKHSWIGKNIAYRNSGGDRYEHNWLVLIAPALMEFFFHWQALMYSEDGFKNFVLCIDSLALKFEGILRDFAKVIGAPSQVHSKGWNREAYIEDLLEDEKIKSYFSEDDLLLFKYLFTSQGKNIRNNVAHSFYKFHHYKPELMILIIMAVLRISKYQVRVDKLVL